MTRVTRVDGEIGVVKAGAVIEIEYDFPDDEWYFRENGAATMPFCVFLEAALQPCGWLASFVGSALTTEEDLLFRNLDGKATIKAEVLPGSGTFRTVVKITNVSMSAGMIIESFSVRCFIGDVECYELETVFGFFPKAAFVNQVGLPITPEHRALLDEAFARRGLPWNLVLSAMDADVIKTYVELGMGVGIIASMAFDEARDSALHAIDARHLFDWLGPD